MHDDVSQSEEKSHTSRSDSVSLLSESTRDGVRAHKSGQLTSIETFVGPKLEEHVRLRARAECVGKRPIRSCSGIILPTHDLQLPSLVAW